MKWSDPGLCPTASFGRNSIEYVGSVTREFISYSFPIWQGLHLVNENVQTLTMVNNCETRFDPEANSEVISNYK
jgi:hypothetical protein